MSSSFIVIDEIEEALNTVSSTLTSNISAVKTVVDSISTNVATNNTASTTGTLSQKISSAISNTAATTTENASGTLSAKLTYLINRRDKIVTPGSTNLKTLNSSGSVSVGGKWGDAKQTTISANGSTYSCYVKYSGKYRAYFTASLTWTNYTPDTMIAPRGSKQTGTATGVVKVTHASSNATTEHTVKIVEAQQANASAATKTVDFPAQAGDVVQMFVKLSETSDIYDNCSEAATRPYVFDTFKATWTDISVRGTVNEINGATT